MNQITREQRNDILGRNVSELVSQGYRPESTTETQAVLARGKRVNHLLHLILSLITFGAWVFVWVPLAIFGGEKRVVLSVDEWGNVSRS